MGELTHTLAGQALWIWRQQAIAQARAAAIDPAEVDWLLKGLCQIDGLSLRLGTLASQPAIASQVSLTDLTQLWEKRVRDRVPLQHLVGQTPWRSFQLHVSPAVLIPRPETELIIDLAVQQGGQSDQAESLRCGTWVDLGTGSGAIAIGLAAALPNATILAVDVSADALAIAQRNAVENDLSDRIQFLQGSWFEPLASWRGQLAGMVSNPPYIPTAIVPTLAPEVAQHEPHLALDGGQDGLDCVRHLAQTAPAYLRPGGLWLVELMQGQAVTAAHLLADTKCYRNIQTASDLAGIDRFVYAHRRDQ